MLIGIDASRANKPRKTGVEWYSYHLIEEFKKIDKDNRYFLYTNKPLQGDLAECPPNFEEKVLNWFLPRTWTLGRLSWEMKFAKEIPDVLFVPAHTLPLLTPREAVVTIHDLGFEHFPSAYHWADKFYHKLIIKIIKRRATKIIAVSNFTKEDITKTYGIPAEKIAVVQNGYDDDKYKVLADDGRLKKKYNIDFPFILFVGRLELKKNVPRLVEAFAKFKRKYPADKHKLVLIGTSGLTFSLVQKQIDKFNLAEEVIFPGWVDAADLPYFYNKADLFVFPSLFEGFGIPLLEAFACGCPVICSGTTSLPEVAGEAALMFNPEKTEEITSRMEQVLLNESVAESLRVKGLRRARNFSWRRAAEDTLRVLTHQF